MIDKVVKRKGVLDLPIVGSKYLRKIGNRYELQNPDNVKRIATNNIWTTFKDDTDYINKNDSVFEKKSGVAEKYYYRLRYLKELVDVYKEFQPLVKIHTEYCELKGFKKISYGKTHAAEHEKYEELKEKYNNLAGEDKRFRPKEWNAEIEELEQKLADNNKESVSLITSLATAEVIKYNKGDLERQIQNDEHEKSNKISKKII